jgi:Asp-tRNA(Asn)/Glu-tRNA(Gln) amidotransferase A subunit family amidase
MPAHAARGRFIKPLNELTATEIVAAIGSGATSAEAVTRACLERIAARDGEVHAWAHLDADAALDRARTFDQGNRRGLLGGVPFGVKDIIDTFDMSAEWGTPIHKGRQPGRDAACVALTRKAGGVLLGKTVTTEFANPSPGPTRNPHDLSRTPAGSSSGSAAAVADLMVPIALGTQTTGSTIRPASFCGVFGYRPTHGEHRLHGVMEGSGSLDTLGLFARSVADLALTRDVLLGIAPEPPPKIARPHFALCRTHIWDQVEPNTRSLIEDAALRLARAGARVTEFTPPAEFELLPGAHRTIASFEFARTITWEIENHWNEISDTLRGGMLREGMGTSFKSYLEAKQLAAECRQRLDALLSGIDALLTPAAFGEAPVGAASPAGTPIHQLWSTLHVPEVTIPVFKGPAGMPIGAMLVGKRHDDRKLFACAQWAWDRLT